MRPTKYMPFTRKKRLFEKYEPIGGRRPTAPFESVTACNRCFWATVWWKASAPSSKVASECSIRWRDQRASPTYKRRGIFSQQYVTLRYVESPADTCSSFHDPTIVGFAEWRLLAFREREKSYFHIATAEILSSREQWWFGACWARCSTMATVN